MSENTQPTNAKINLHALESRAEEITKATQAINAMTRLLEAFRAHNADECPLDTDDINKLAANGYILSSLSGGIELLSGTIDTRMYELLELGNKQG